MPTTATVNDATKIVNTNNEGEIVRDSSGNTHLKKKYEDSGAPTILDDASEGYELGSLGFDTIAKKFYRCSDPTMGAAQWEQLGGVSLPGVANAALYDVGDGTIGGTISARITAGGQATFHTCNGLNQLSTGIDFGSGYPFEVDNVGAASFGSGNATIDASGNATFAGNVGIGGKVTYPRGASYGTWFGDGDTGIYEEGANQITYHLNGADRYRMYATSFWSIGTSGFKVLVSGRGTSNPTYSWNSDDDTGLGSSGDNTLYLQTGGNDALTIDASQNATFAGDVGIGGSPVSGYPLTVLGTDVMQQIKCDNIGGVAKLVLHGGNGWVGGIGGAAGQPRLYGPDRVSEVVQWLNNGVGVMGAAVADYPLTTYQSVDGQGLRVYGYDDENDHSSHLAVNSLGSGELYLSNRYGAGDASAFSITQAGSNWEINAGGANAISFEGGTNQECLIRGDSTGQTKAEIAVSASSKTIKMYADSVECASFDSGGLDVTGTLDVSSTLYAGQITLDGTRTISTNTGNTNVKLRSYGRTTAGTALSLNDSNCNLTNSSGDAIGVEMTTVVNQTLTAGATDLLINRTETATGSGNQFLIDAQIGGSSKFSVDNTGLVTSPVGYNLTAGATGYGFGTQNSSTYGASMYVYSGYSRLSFKSHTSKHTEITNSAGLGIQFRSAIGELLTITAATGNVKIAQGDLELADGSDILIGNSAGTQIGTASTDKLGFLGATPTSQQSHVADPSGGSTIDSEARTAINAILSTLETFGFHAAS